MDVGKAIILGIVQGLTEFLPISSSGHLVLGKHLLGLQEQGIQFEVFVHFGSLLAVLTVFSRDIGNLVKAFFAFFSASTRAKGVRAYYHENADFRLLLFIIMASVPAAIIGLALQDQIETAFGSPRFACSMLIVTAVILFLTLFVKKADGSLTLRNTLIMGLAQAVAILPGISRSGSTISAGLYQKVNGREAARFSFLLAVPAVLGATALKAVELVEFGIGGDMFMQLAAGMIAAYVSGFLAIESLLAVVGRGKLYWFAPYCLLVGVLGLIFIK
ncbi:undecaprenyl-diphosphate phosphatase [candidate division KSB1 bacterium]|nr:undecaprenyl-diphosphate phosphatase [candidate division KSB1 bacterium]RQW11471.1 MAG: undecaprenyl-diphosphate phosphatase [candidate division KSB1 bacterium]